MVNLVNTRIVLDNGTAAQWTAANPVLQVGEPGYESDTGKIKYGDGTTAWTSLPYFVTGNLGTVTSVAQTVPTSILSVAGSPVTTSGTLAISLVTQAANTVWAGPTSGAAANPTFRALVATDIPAIPESGVTNLVSDLAGKQPNITLTTNGTSGAATLAGATLNIPSYAGSAPPTAQEFSVPSASNGNTSITVTLTTPISSVFFVTLQGQKLDTSEVTLNSSTSLTITPAGHTFATGEIIFVSGIPTVGTTSANGFSAPNRTVTGTYNVVAADYFLIADASSAPVVINLYNPSTAVGNNLIISVIDGTNSITVNASSAQPIKQTNSFSVTSDSLVAGDTLSLNAAGSYWKQY